MSALPDAPARPVGWWALFLLLGLVSVMLLNGLSSAAPDVHTHGGAGLAALPHGALLALPLAMLLVVVLRLREPHLYVAVGLALLGVALGAWF